MPPGPAYNWYVVAHSALDILSRAAQGRTAQAESQAVRVLRRDTRPTPRTASATAEEGASVIVPPPGRRATSVPELSEAPSTHQPAHVEPEAKATPAWIPAEPIVSPAEAVVRPSLPETLTVAADSGAPQARSPLPLQQPQLPKLEDLSYAHPARDVPEAADSAFAATVSEVPQDHVVSSPPSRKLQSSKVPSSRIGRLFHYGGLAASLGYGAASELVRRSAGSSSEHSSLMMTEGNIKRLVSKLTQMRGAALKLGQFMSIQDSHVLPPEVEDIFRRVQDAAHYMPDWQMEQVMQTSLGPSWKDNFASFDRVPFAAASIGQVHAAVLSAAVSPTGRDAPVAVKIQFPNIADSIASDLGYVKLLLTAGRLLPKGLFLDRTIEVMKAELADECDYAREAGFLRRFGAPDVLGGDPRFKVPWAWAGSTQRVLVMERVGGVSVGGGAIAGMSQADRNEIATRIIDLCLKELFVFRAMQTDPNWTNFLWNGTTRQIELVDFGATREYSAEFIHSWLRLLQAAAAADRAACIDWSLRVGYLTGAESEAMLDAHVDSLTLLATPFRRTTPQPFAFGPRSPWAAAAAAVRAHVPVMLRERLTPPPRESYSLNRKLSGAFLLAARLDAEVDCGALWEDVVGRYEAQNPV